LEKAAAYGGENPRIFHNLAIAYWQQDKVEPAVASFRRAIELVPENPEYLQNLVQLLMQKGRWTDALTQAKQMSKLLPNNPQIASLISQIQSNLKP
jgi:Flp pilus assembly protein TadD